MTRTRCPKKAVAAARTSTAPTRIFVGRTEAGLQFKVQRNGAWQEELVTKPLRQSKAWLDGKVVPITAVALKPGRRCWLATYRNGPTLMILYMSTRKGEIDGTVTKIDGSKVTISGSEIDPDAGEQTFTIDGNARVLVDGIDGAASAIQVGQYVRVFPARNQSVVALKEWKPSGDGFLPVASFRSPETVLGTNTVEFDASSSYGHGQEIKSYAWDFGDGKTAEGAQGFPHLRRRSLRQLLGDAHRHRRRGRQGQRQAARRHRSGLSTRTEDRRRPHRRLSLRGLVRDVGEGQRR